MENSFVAFYTQSNLFKLSGFCAIKVFSDVFLKEDLSLFKKTAILKKELLISSIDLHDSPIVGKWLVNFRGDTWPLKWDMDWNLVQFRITNTNEALS